MSNIAGGIDSQVFRGNVLGFQEIVDFQRWYKTWQFVVMQENRATGEKRQIPVKMVGFDFRGILRNSDVVRITGKIVDGNLVPEEIINETLSNSKVEVLESLDQKILKKPVVKKIGILWFSLPIVMLLLFLSIFGFVLFNLFTM